jgi:hypothetical protein
VDVGQSFEADAQAAKVVQPGMGALDDPTGLAQAAAVRFATPGNLGGDAGCVQWPAILVVVVTAVGLDDDRLGQRSPPLATDGRDCFDQRQELRDVVAVGAGQDRRERDALRFGDEVVLGTGTSAVGGVRSCF